MNAESQRRSAKGPYFKEDDSALPLLESLLYMCHRDENWKVMRPILEKFMPPPKPDGELGGPMTPALLTDLPPQPSPRSQRAAEAAAALLNPGETALQNMEPQDRFGMRSR